MAVVPAADWYGIVPPLPAARLVAVPDVKPAAVPVIFVPTKAEGVSRFGVTRVGEMANTAAPLPVSSVSAPDRFAEVNVPREVALPAEVTAPERLALVVTVAALPVMLVMVKVLSADKS